MLDEGFEVMPRAGELRSRDVRALYGEILHTLPHVDVLVLDIEGRVPVAARVALVSVTAGARTHRILVCPRCEKARYLLVARHGELRCRTCDRTRTRRQLERTTADWRRRGAREEDRLLRLLSRPTLSRTNLRLARAFVDGLVAADRARLGELGREIEVLQCCAQLRI